MRTNYLLLLFALNCTLGCSPPMAGSCGEGMVACMGSCVPTGTACGVPDAGEKDTSLSALSAAGGTLSPAFSSSTTMYTVTVPFQASSVQLTATAADSSATLLINGMQVASGAASAPILMGSAPMPIAVVVQVGGVQKSYDVLLTRAPIDYLKASNTDANDNFGISVALSGDTLAVGASQEASNGTGINGSAQANNSAANSGAVYVFIRAGTQWTQQAYIKASNTDANDQFGYSVSLSGDTLAVGANQESSKGTGVNSAMQADNSVPRSGAVYVFTRSGTVWTQQAYIKSSNPDVNDQLGYSVSLFGDTLAAGARGESSKGTGVNSATQADNSAVNSGAVYVFTRSGTVWTQQAYLKASNTDTKDDFGYTISLSDDTLAVGAEGESSNGTGVNSSAQADNSASASGAVYVFTRTGTVWTQQAYLKASNAGVGDNFGWSVSLSGDTLAVGAIGEASNGMGDSSTAQADNSVQGAGAVYVFTRTGTIWKQQSYLKASNIDSNDNFGNNVSVFGDTLAVGSLYESSNGTGINSAAQADNSASGSGAVYVFTRSGTQWTSKTYIKASNSDADDGFGYGFALSSDTLAVGSPGESSKGTGVNSNTRSDNSAMASGAVYVYR